MTRPRWGALILAAVAVLAVAAFAATRARKPADVEQVKPTLLLLTSLPLIFNDQFSLEGSSSPALKILQRRYHVVPISTTSPAELSKGRLALLAQPPAQAPENLVALDDWVRGGGRLLLLADPMLEWPSERPLGDPLRPPPMFVDTGLLQHWGLRLDAPDQRGAATRQLGGYRVLTASPGTLSGSCAIDPDRLGARCAIGKGRATIIADADLLDTSDLGSGASDNLDAVLAELASLQHH